MDSRVLGMVSRVADDLGLDADLCKAIAIVESNAEFGKARYEPAFKYFHMIPKWAVRFQQTETTEKILQAMSWGPMQIMGATARDRGFTGNITELATEYPSVFWACKHLEYLDNKYESEEHIISAYNAGSPRKVPTGDGFEFVNQGYVDKVKSYLREFRNQEKKKDL